MLSFSVAHSAQSVAHAKQVRWQVYREEEGMLPAYAACRELALDAVHPQRVVTDLLVYSGADPVGAVRLEVGQASSHGAGGAPSLALTTKLALSGFNEPGTVLGEVTRFCVLRAFRGTRVAGLLFGGLRRESERRGVTHWLAAANMETDSSEDADIAYRLAQQQELMSRDFQARAREASGSTPSPRRSAYTDEQRQAARSGRLADLKLPKTLALFANKMGARFLGPPIYDHYFNVFALPLAVRLADLARPPLPETRKSLRAPNFFCNVDPHSVPGGQGRSAR